MTPADSALGIRGHSLVAASKADDSVTKWRCLDCSREYDCASRYLDHDCAR